MFDKVMFNTKYVYIKYFILIIANYFTGMSFSYLHACLFW